MTEPSDKLSLALTKEVLKQVAPGELYWADRFVLSQDSHGVTAKGPGGFGVGGVAAMLLPVVYLFLDGFIGELKERITKAGKSTADVLISKVVSVLAGDSTERDANSAAALIQRYLVSKGVAEDRAEMTSKAILRVVGDNAAKLRKL
jgi:hypothetical protein